MASVQRHVLKLCAFLLFFFPFPFQSWCPFVHALGTSNAASGAVSPYCIVVKSLACHLSSLCSSRFLFLSRLFLFRLLKFGAFLKLASPFPSEPFPPRLSVGSALYVFIRNRASATGKHVRHLMQPNATMLNDGRYEQYGFMHAEKSRAW